MCIRKKLEQLRIKNELLNIYSSIKKSCLIFPRKRKWAPKYCAKKKKWDPLDSRWKLQTFYSSNHENFLSALKKDSLIELAKIFQAAVAQRSERIFEINDLAEASEPEVRNTNEFRLQNERKSKDEKWIEKNGSWK